MHVSPNVHVLTLGQNIFVLKEIVKNIIYHQLYSRDPLSQDLWGPETRIVAHVDRGLISLSFCQYTPIIAHVVSGISVFF